VCTRLSIPFAAMCSVAVAQNAFAQQTVQQPVVEQFSVGSVVSVPDQGRMLLGGISSAGSSQKDFGPLPWGTLSGRSASHSSLDVGVFIHDFEAMDAALLAQPTRRSQAGSASARFRSPRAAAAWRVLRER